MRSDDAARGGAAAGDDEEEASFQGLGLGDELSLNFLRFLTLKRPKILNLEATNP